MKEISNQKLANLVQTPYSKGGDIFMATEGSQDMPPKPQSTSPEHSEGTYGKRATDIKTLDEDSNLPVGVRRALEDIKRQEVSKNALLEDAERINIAAKLLKRDLTEKEKEALLKAHHQGKGEIGKDNNKAGIYNYTKSQLLKKVRILNKAGFNEKERRILVEAGIIGSAVNKTGIPSIDAEIDAMTNVLGTGLKSPLGVYVEAMTSISKLTGVDDSKKQAAINEIKQAIEKAHEENEKNRPAEEQERRYSLYFTPAEQISLRDDPSQWMDTQFDILYRFAEEGQELSSPIINGIQQQVGQAVDFVKNYRPEVLSDFQKQYTGRLHLLQMRAAIGYKDMEQVKGAAQQLRAHGLLLGMTLEGGKVGAMFNRFQDKLEETRLWSNRRHHVMLEDVLKVQRVLIEEQMDLAKKGRGSFGDLSDISDVRKNPNAQAEFAAVADANMTDLYIKNREKELADELQSNNITGNQKKTKQDELNKLVRIKKIKKISADILRTTRTAYDVFVSSQRMGVIVSRGKYLLKDQSRFRSDPIGPLNVYNMEDLTINRFDMYSPHQEESINRMKLDMAENYLKEQKKIPEANQKELTREQKIDLGKRLFRDLFAVPDFFSSGWRIEGVIQALEQRFEVNIANQLKESEVFENSLSPEEKVEYSKQRSDSTKKIYRSKVIRERAVEKAKDFALFMRLRHTGQEQVSNSVDRKGIAETREKRVGIWGKIKDYRPEEIVRLFRERKNDKIKDLYDEMVKLDPELELNAEERLANRPDDEGEGGRGRDLTVYDKFKLKYGAAIGLLRQEGFNYKDENGNQSPMQINLAKLGEDTELGRKQRDIVNKFLEDDKGAEKLIRLAEAMQNFIDPNPPVKDGDEVKNSEKKRTLIDDLLTDNDFADIYTRSIIIDDALLDKIEDEKPDVIGKLGVSELGYVPFSKMIGEAGAGNDTLTRSWNDTGNAIEAGNTLVNGYIKEENLGKKTEGALKFATLASSYNGLGSRGQAECVRYTIGSYLNLAKLDMAWDIIGINALPFRIPASEAQRIFGVQAAAIGRDELRGYADHLRGYMNSSISKVREALKERKKEILESELSDKNRKDARNLTLSEEKIIELKSLNLSKKELKERKSQEGERKFQEEAGSLTLSEEEKAEAIRLNLSEDQFKENKLVKEILIRNLEEKFKKDEVDSHRFYKDLEDTLEVNADDAVKRFGFRFLLYLLLAAMGETYKIGEESFKDASK